MSLEPASMDKVKKIAKHFGLVPIRIRGTSSINICKNFNDKKYDLITWDDFEQTLEAKGLQVYVESSSAFLKIMKKRRVPIGTQKFSFYLQYPVAQLSMKIF